FPILKAGYIAHGSTGAGNDQVRFDMIFHIMLPEVTILTPVRDQRLSRQDSIYYLIKNGVKQDWSKARYSINKGLWGTSVGGIETLTSDGYLPEDAYPTQVTKTEPQIIELEFENGEPVGLDKERFDNPVHVVEKLETLAGSYGIGRDIHVGDTIIGIKGRVGFEAAAPMIILKAHQLLEKHVLTKWQIYWKDQLANWYGNLLHEGQYLDPAMRDMEQFFQSTQENVTGEVKI
ncbi:MAG: argininosuccinate synthase domain-containing protein, partial [Calditrichota bacterium]